MRHVFAVLRSRGSSWDESQPLESTREIRLGSL